MKQCIKSEKLFDLLHDSPDKEKVDGLPLEVAEENVHTRQPILQFFHLFSTLVTMSRSQVTEELIN